MKELKKSFDLGCGLEAIIKVARVGQDFPSDSDQVVVRGTLFLPKHEENGNTYYHLHADLKFGNRCKIMGYPLWDDWGSTTQGDCFRWISETTKADTWKQAFANMEERLETEVYTLKGMLIERELRLKEAEAE